MHGERKRTSGLLERVFAVMYEKIVLDTWEIIGLKFMKGTETCHRSD